MTQRREGGFEIQRFAVLSCFRTDVSAIPYVSGLAGPRCRAAHRATHGVSPLRAFIADACALRLPDVPSSALDGSVAPMAANPIGQAGQLGARRTAVNPRPAPASPVLGV